jgi:cation transport ATPase
MKKDKSLTLFGVADQKLYKGIRNMNKPTFLKISILFLVALLIIIPFASAGPMNWNSVGRSALIGAVIGGLIGLSIAIFYKLKKPRKLRKKTRYESKHIVKQVKSVQKKKFSISAIFLMILLTLRFIGQLGLMYILLSLVVFPLLYFLLIFLFMALYLAALIGIVRKTKWGLDVTIVVATIDIFFLVILIFVEGSVSNYIFALFVDVVLLGLAGNIKNRIKRRRYSE